MLFFFLNASAAGAPLNVSGLLAEMRAEGWATSPPLVGEPPGRRWPMEVVLLEIEIINWLKVNFCEIVNFRDHEKKIVEEIKESETIEIPASNPT